MAKADDLEQVKGVCEAVPEYKGFFEGNQAGGEASAEMLEDRMFKLEVQREFKEGYRDFGKDALELLRVEIHLSLFTDVSLVPIFLYLHFLELPIAFLFHPNLPSCLLTQSIAS